MAKFTASILINASSNIKQVSDWFKKSFDKMARSSSKLNAALRKNSETINRMGASARRMGAVMGGIVAAGIGAAIAKGSEFQTALQDLSALTGSTGKALDDMGARALDLSKKYGVGAPKILETNKLIASSIPALLKQPKLLAKVTDEAVKLAKASRMELGQATAALTTTLNQFNLTGEDANRVINTLAAGAKEGAAPIPFLSEAIEKAGTTFALMGISVEQSVALVETIAPKFAKASLAGNSLDKAFQKMREEGIGLKDGLFDVNTALDQIRKGMKDGESVADTFGVEHAKVIEVLLQGQSEYNRYAKAVSGTNEAQIQADKNMKTFRESMSRLGTAIQKSLIEKFLQYEPQLTAIVEKITAFIGNQEKMTAIIKKAKIIIAGLVAVVIAMTVAQIALNVAMVANPIGLIIAGIALAVGVVVSAITAIVLNWDKIVAAMKIGVEKIKGFFSDTAFGKILMLPFLPIIRVIKLIMKGISAIKRWRGKGKGEEDIALAELGREINVATVGAVDTGAIKTSQTLDVNMTIDQQGRATVNSATSDNGLNFTSEATMLPEI